MPTHRSQLRPQFRAASQCLGGLLLLAACGGTPAEPDPGGSGGAGIVLAFVAPPGRAEGQVAFAPALEVEARDEKGARITSWSGAVTISLKQNPGSATLRGTLTRQAAGGVARFDDLTIDIPATGYTLLATSGSQAVESQPFDVGLTMAMVSAGRHYTCGVTRAGKGYCWGRNDSGEHGTGERQLSTVPMPVSGGYDFATLSAGQSYTCGVTTEGKGHCWGAGGEGELGVGEAVTWKATPMPVAGNLVFSTISTAFRFACGVTKEGQGHCWGYGKEGQLGTGATGSSLSPTPVAGGLEFKAITSGEVHSCGVTKAGQAYCWGWGANGALGDGAKEDRHQPTAVTGGVIFASAMAGNLYGCGLTSAGKAYCWGISGGGALGNGSTAERLTPTPVAGDLTFASLSVASRTCGVTTAGKGYCWGSGHDGALGNGGTADALVPTAVAGTLNFASISVGNTHACGVTTTGEAYCWGDNSTGQLGSGAFSSTPSTVPVLVFGTKQ